jgi:CO/xanthine dehydrogenase Mo-binding subunit
VWGPVEEAFAGADHRLSFRASWGRSATVPIETFGVVASWDAGTQILDIWAVDPDAQVPRPDRARAAAAGNAVRVHYDVDVGGSYGVKRGIKHTVLAGYLARKLGAPVRLIEDRLENMRGGDMQGPDRVFDLQAAFDRDGTIRGLRIRARRRRRRLRRTLAASARQAGRRHLRPLPHPRDRVRAGLGDDQQDAAGGGARLRTVADQLRHRAHRGPLGAAPRHGPDRAAQEEPDPQGRVFPT